MKKDKEKGAIKMLNESRAQTNEEIKKEMFLKGSAALNSISDKVGLTKKVEEAFNKKKGDLGLER